MLFYQAVPDLAKEMWGYLDPAGTIHNGFAASKIVKWHEKGFFNESTKVRLITLSGDALVGPWCHLSSIISLLKASIERDDSPPPHSQPLQAHTSNIDQKSTINAGLPPRPIIYSGSSITTGAKTAPMGPPPDRITSRSSQDARDEPKHASQSHSLSQSPKPQTQAVTAQPKPDGMGFGAAMNQYLKIAEKRRIERERATNEMFGVLESSPPPAAIIRAASKEKRQDTPMPAAGIKSNSRPPDHDRSSFRLGDELSSSSPLPSPPLQPAPNNKTGYGAVMTKTIDAAEKRRIEKERATNELFGIFTPVPTSKPSVKEKKPPHSPFANYDYGHESHPSTVSFLGQIPLDLPRQQNQGSNANGCQGESMVISGALAVEADCWGSQVVSHAGDEDYISKDKGEGGTNWSSPTTTSPLEQPSGHLSHQPSLTQPSPSSVNKPMTSSGAFVQPDSLEERLFYAGLPHNRSPWWWYTFDNGLGHHVTNGPFPPEQITERWRKGNSFRPGVKLVGLAPDLDVRFPPPLSFFKSLEELERMCSDECGSTNDLLGATCYQPFTAMDSRRVNEEGLTEPNEGWNSPPPKKYVYGKEQMIALGRIPNSLRD